MAMKLPFPPTNGWVEILPGARQKILVRSPDVVLMLYDLAPNLKFRPHVHPLAQMGFILEGGGRHTIGGEVRRARAGDSYYIPPNVEHDFSSLRDTRTLLVDAVVADRLKDPSREGVVRWLDGTLSSSSFRTLARRL